MSFSPDWLALREPADHAARDDALVVRLREHLAGARPPGELRIVDLGCGTGSNLRHLAPRLPPGQRWTLVDHDPALLRRLPPQPGCEALELDLARDLERLPLREAALVTASALLDLVSDDWVDRLLAAFGQARPALLFVLTYDGTMAWTPGHADDPRIAAAFNRHQRSDKGFGPALGPAAVAAVRSRLRAAGYAVTVGASDWRLGPGEAALQRSLTVGVAEAAASVVGSNAARAEATDADAAGADADWLRFRLEAIDAGRGTLRVGHADLLALPG